MRIDPEKVLLILFFGLMLWLGMGTLFSHTLDHAQPYGYSASDAYQHQVRTAWIQEQGNYAQESPAIVAGFDNVVGYYMPGAFHLAAIFANVSGLHSWDALYFMVYLFAILSALVLYFAVRVHNRHVALLCLPVTTLIFAKTFYIGILLGQWPFTFGTLFLVFTLWSLVRLGMTDGAALLSLAVAAVAMTHTSELVFVVGFIGVAFLLFLLKKDIVAVKKIIASGIVAFGASAYYLLIFTFTWGLQFGYKFFVERVNMGFPNVRLFADFSPWILFVMAVGMMGLYFRNTLVAAAGGLALLVLAHGLGFVSNPPSDTVSLMFYFTLVAAFLAVVVWKKPSLAAVFAPYMLIIGYSNFVGFGPRAFQTRFLWPITLAPLFAYGMYKLVMLISSRSKFRWTLLHTVVLTVLLTGAVIGSNYEARSTPGTMYTERWQMFEWLQDNVDDGNRVFFFFGDSYDQTSMLYNAGVAYVYINTDDYIGTLNNQTVKRDYQYSVDGDYGPGYPHRTGIFSFEYNIDGPVLRELQGDVCQFPYYVFDKVTGNQQMEPLIRYNLFIRDLFMQHGMTVVFENAATSVVRNNNPGGECVG